MTAATTLSKELSEIANEFKRDNFKSTLEQDTALLTEILKLRKFREDVAALSLYLCGGHYEPRTSEERAIVGRIILALDKSGADILRRESWMARGSVESF